jgi:hypothetical protein
MNLAGAVAGQGGFATLAAWRWSAGGGLAVRPLRPGQLNVGTKCLQSAEKACPISYDAGRAGAWRHQIAPAGEVWKEFEMRRFRLGMLAFSLLTVAALATAQPAAAAKAKATPPDVDCTADNGQVSVEVDFGGATWNVKVLTIEFSGDGFDSVKLSKKNVKVGSKSITADYDGDDSDVSGSFSASLNKDQTKLSFSVVDSTNGITVAANNLETECTPD